MNPNKSKNKYNYLNILSSSLVDNTENIVDKKGSEIENIITNEAKETQNIETLSPTQQKESNSIKTQIPKVKDNIALKYKKRNNTLSQPKQEIKSKDPLDHFSPAVKKVLQKRMDDFEDLTSTRISSEANKYLKIMALTSSVAAYKIVSSLVIDFYNKHKEEFNI